MMMHDDRAFCERLLKLIWVFRFFIFLIDRRLLTLTFHRFEYSIRIIALWFCLFVLLLKRVRFGFAA
jgi:hypothetical protein